MFIEQINLLLLYWMLYCDFINFLHHSYLYCKPFLLYLFAKEINFLYKIIKFSFCCDGVGRWGWASKCV